MVFNNMVNFGIFLSGILHSVGVIGGLAFWGYLIGQAIAEYKSYKSDRKNKCKTCAGYNACFAAFGGQLPEDGCAYYKNDEEVEISAN